MNTRVALCVGLAAIALGALLLFVSHLASPSPTQSLTPTATTTVATSSAPQGARPPQNTGSHTAPTVIIGPETVSHWFAAFDQASLTSTSTYPIITGTANMDEVGMIIYDSHGVSITGTAHIAVTKQGQWLYAPATKLVPGRYTLLLLYGSAHANAVLTVVAP